MPLHIATRRALIGGGADYARKILTTESDSLIGFWKQNETGGSTSIDYSGKGNDGSYTGVTLADAKFRTGAPVPFFDGTNDYNDISAIASELLSTPGFESLSAGADVWASWSDNVGDGALANETVEIHTGADAAKVTAGASADTYVDQNITVVPGETYNLRFWARGDGSDEGRYSIYDVDNAADIVATTGTGVTGTSYAKVSQDFTAPAGCTTVRIRLQCSTTNTAVSYFDTVSCRDVTRWDGQEFTVLIWARVANAGVWTDSTYRFSLVLFSSGSNYTRIAKHSNNGELIATYRAGGTSKNVQIGGFSDTDWMPLVITCSKSADELKWFKDGSQIGATQTGLGTWVGGLDNERTLIGASDSSPITYPWHGWLGPVAVWNTPLTPSQVAYVSSV